MIFLSKRVIQVQSGYKWANHVMCFAGLKNMEHSKKYWIEELQCLQLISDSCQHSSSISGGADQAPRAPPRVKQTEPEQDALKEWSGIAWLESLALPGRDAAAALAPAAKLRAVSRLRPAEGWGCSHCSPWPSGLNHSIKPNLRLLTQNRCDPPSSTLQIFSVNLVS